MNDRIEGTIVLDGLVEGQVAGVPDAESLLRQWVRTVASLGLHFSLESDGSSFSLLADNRPVAADQLGPRPAEAIGQALGELLAIFREPERGRLFSTVRSIEYRKGAEIQTLYVVTPDGRVEAKERTVEAWTEPPPRRLTRKEILRLTVIGVIVALLVFAMSSFFVDYRALVGRAVEAVRPFDVERLEVDTARFDGYFTFEKASVSRDGREVILTLKRGEAFPQSEDDVERLLTSPGPSPAKRLAIEAIARGYVRCEYFDKDGEFIESTEQRIAELRRQATVEVSLPLPRKRRPVRVVITY